MVSTHLIAGLALTLGQTVRDEDPKVDSLANLFLAVVGPVHTGVNYRHF